MSSANTFEEAKDKALEVLASYLSDDELVDFSNYNIQGSCSPEDRDKFMTLTNMHQHALYQLGLSMMECKVEGEGALEVFTDMLGMTEEALRQLRETEQKSDDAPEVGGGSPGTNLGQVESTE